MNFFINVLLIKSSILIVNLGNIGLGKAGWGFGCNCCRAAGIAANGAAMAGIAATAAVIAATDAGSAAGTAAIAAANAAASTGFGTAGTAAIAAACTCNGNTRPGICGISAKT